MMWRRAVGVAVGTPLLPVVGAATAAAQPPPTHTEPVTIETIMARPCSDRLFVGVRGSGEDPPYGRTIDALRDRLLAQMPQQVASTYVDYPAVAPQSLSSKDLDGLLLSRGSSDLDYFRSVDTGVRELTRLLQWSARTCPRQSLVLVGFSQGAEVITKALAAGAPSATVTATILLGNPMHFPGQNAQELDQEIGSSAMGLVSTLTFLRARALPDDDTDHRAGVRNLVEQVFRLHEGRVSTSEIADAVRRSNAVLPASGYERTFSICRDGDIVCDATPAMSRVLTSQSTLEEEFERNYTVHMGYTPEASARTLREVVRLWQDPRRAAAKEEQGDAAAPVAWAAAAGLLVGAVAVRLGTRLLGRHRGER